MDYKKVNAPLSTITRDMNSLSAEVGNLYETVSLIAKRANQIDKEVKKELDEKIQEVAMINDSLEEVFDNKEQIEVSRFYEKMPKATLLAAEEFRQGKVFYKRPATNISLKK